MIAIVAEFEFPAESRDRLLDTVRDMDAKTNQEPGCIHYRHAIDVRNENRLVLSEIWSDAQALLDHFRTPHFRAFRAAAVELNVRTKLKQCEARDIAEDDDRHWKALLRISEL